ncbi:hypothetical protein [Marinoscillum sp.]|uniref:hypothetical protein n=1 Tax=Marinoscillum sp. TaxID=2024838 RepID=UPI003BAA2AC8
MKSTLFSLLLLLGPVAFSQDIFLIENHNLYKKAKEKGLHRSTFINNSELFPQLTDNTSDKAFFNSKVIIFHQDKLVIDSVLVESEDGYTGELNFSQKPTKGYILINFKSIRNAIPSDQKLKITLKSSDDQEVFSFSVIYSFFPGADREATVQDHWIGAYEPDEKDTKYYYVHQMVRALDEPMYLSLFPQFINWNDPYGLDNYEFYIMEGNFSMPFTIVQGRNDQSDKLRRSSISVDPEFTWRITSGNSAPLLPLNTKVGISGHRSHIKDGEAVYSLSEKFKEDPNYKFTITSHSIQLKHYSNGQEDAAAYTGPGGSRIVNLKSGNFSANSVKYRIVQSSLNENHRQLSYGASAQIFIPKLGYEPEQEDRYGYVKLSGLFMIKSGPMTRSFLEFNKHRNRNRTSFIPSLTQNSLRIQLDFFTPTSKYVGYNNNPFRYGSIKVRYDNEPIHNRSVGWFTQFYYGRDYLNVRYQIVTLSAMVGVSFRFNKDLPDQDFLKKRLLQVYDYYNGTDKLEGGIINQIKQYNKENEN